METLCVKREKTTGSSQSSNLLYFEKITTRVYVFTIEKEKNNFWRCGLQRMEVLVLLSPSSLHSHNGGDKVDNVLLPY